MSRGPTRQAWTMVIPPLLALLSLQGCVVTDDGWATGPGRSITAGPKSGRGDLVFLALNEIRLVECVPFIEETTGKRVNLDDRPEVRDHRFSLWTKELVTRLEAVQLVLDQLRLDGLEVSETRDAIDIRLGEAGGSGPD